jgi:hypothetical protein
MNRKDATALATVILTDLFTAGNGQKATRLVLVVEKPGEKTVDLGGWSFGPALDRITDILEASKP